MRKFPAGLILRGRMIRNSPFDCFPQLVSHATVPCFYTTFCCVEFWRARIRGRKTMPRPTFEPGVLRAQGEDIRNRSVRSRRPDKLVLGTGMPVNWVDVGVDPKDVSDNEALAEKIRDLITAMKSNSSGQRFMIGWRMYPNTDHPDWDETLGSEGGWKPDSEGHSCGCGCGCGS